jgi:hypothetical protein
LSVAPLIVIPAPSAVVLVGVATSAIIIFLSSTTRFVELRLVVVPFTVRSPVTTRLLFTVVVPVEAPIESVVAAPAKFMVVAVVLRRAKVVDPVVILVVNAGDVPNTSTPEPVSSEITPASSEELVEANCESLPPVYATVPPAPNATDEESVPVNVRVLLAVSVLPSAIVRVAEVAGAVKATLLILVAVATPRTGVTRVGVFANTREPEPVSSVTNVAKLAEVGVPSHVAPPVPILAVQRKSEAFLLSTVSALRFVTTVVDVTVRGAVPVATLDVRVVPLTPYLEKKSLEFVAIKSCSYFKKLYLHLSIHYYYTSNNVFEYLNVTKSTVASGQ